MQLAIIESPFRASPNYTADEAAEYLRLCIRDSILRGESPYASHRMIPGALDDADPAERDIGIRCGYAWWRAASVVAFYTDLGWSEGMRKAYARARTMSIKVEERRLCE